jgi:hypothetical protein
MSHAMVQRIGRFELRESLGEGAAGVFYRGFDPATSRDVSVQLVKLNPQNSVESREEALKQAKAAGAFSHPNVATILDIGTDNDYAYVVREWVEGRSLSSVANEGAPFRVSEVIGWLEQIADAIDYAHTRGIVHGALEPSHVLVTPAGYVKVTGFGTTKVAAKAAHDSHALDGAPEYMAPERVRGDAVDSRADVYSLGAVAYELVTGSPPFASGSVVTTIFKIVNEPVRPAVVTTPGISDEADAAILRALAKDPNDRFESCGAFVSALLGSTEEATAPDVVERAETAVGVGGIFCDQCGVSLPATAQVCTACGTPTIAEPLPAVSRETAAMTAPLFDPVTEPDEVPDEVPTLAPAPVAIPKTEVAPVPVVARAAPLPPPLAAYAESTGTPDLPAPGAPIDAPAKRSLMEGALPVVIIMLLIIAFFVALGFLVAPRLLTPAPAPAPQQSSRMFA